MMNQKIKILLLLGAMLFLAMGARLQVPPAKIYGGLFSHEVTGFGKQQNQQYVIATRARIASTDLIYYPKLIFENPTGNAGGVMIEFNDSDAEITCVGDASGTVSVPCVGTVRHPFRPDDDGFFIDATSPLTTNRTAVFWTGSGDDRPRKVIELQDHSFVVVGSTNAGANITRFSFVTRLLQRPDYKTAFTRRIGNLSNTTSTLEEAVDVKQLPDGNLLVLGNTDQFSANTRSSVYLLKMGLDGAILNFRTYAMDDHLQEWHAREMAIMDNGTIVVVGTSLPLGILDTTGFIMQVSPNLATAVGDQLIGALNGTKSNDLTSVCAMPGTNDFYCAGYLNYLFAPDFRTRDHIVLRCNTGSGLVTPMRMLTRRGMFEDIAVGAGGTTIDAVGTTDLEGDEGAYMLRPNVLLQRYPPNLSNCDSVAYFMNLVRHVVTTQSVFTQASYVNMTIVGTADLSPRNTLVGTHCAASKRAIAVPSSEAPVLGETSRSTPSLYPNPAGDRVTVVLPQGDGSARIQVCDATGRILQEHFARESSTVLALGDLPKGLLLIRIQLGTQFSTLKLVHQ